MNIDYFKSKDELISLVRSSPLWDDRIRFGDIYYDPFDGIATYYIRNDYNAYVFTHESAHMIDFLQRGEIHRLGEKNFGFDRLNFDNDGEITEPKTTKGLLRECRAHAIQLRLFEIIGIKHDPKEFFKDVIRLISGQYKLDDVWNVPPKNGYSRNLKRKFIASAEKGNPDDYWEDFNKVSSMEQKQYTLKEMVRAYNNNKHSDLLKTWDSLWSVMDAKYPITINHDIQQNDDDTMKMKM